MQQNDPVSCTDYFNRIYEETFTDMERYVAVKCPDPSSISDVLQDVYLEYYRVLLRKGIAYANDDRALLFLIAKRKLSRYYSLMQRLRLALPLFHHDETGELVAVEIADTVDTTETVLNAAESARIWSIVQSYPPDVRKIMHLYYYEGMSHAQIAQVLGCSLSNVKNKIYRTLSAIRELEGENEGK